MAVHGALPRCSCAYQQTNVGGLGTLDQVVITVQLAQLGEVTIESQRHEEASVLSVGQGVGVTVLGFVEADPGGVDVCRLGASRESQTCETMIDNIKILDCDWTIFENTGL